MDWKNDCKEADSMKKKKKWLMVIQKLQQLQSFYRYMIISKEK